MKQQSPDSVGNELISEIQKLGQSQGLNTVFSTFLEISAVCLDAQFNPEHREQQKARYAAMTANMTPEELSVYAKMLALLYLEIRKYQDEPRDILGSVYHSLNLNSEWNGQFFTPDNLCRMMAELTGFISEEDLKKKGYATIQDKTTPRLIQFHTLKNAANPPFLGGFSIFGTVAAEAEQRSCQGDSLFSMILCNDRKAIVTE